MKTRHLVWLLTVLLVALIALLWFERAAHTGSPQPEHAAQSSRQSVETAPPTPAQMPPAGSARWPNLEHRATPPPPDDGPETLNPERLVDPLYRARVWRSRHATVYLKSPIRHSPELQQLAALCRAYGYGPWAVSPAYWIAVEHDRHERMMRDWPDVGEENRRLTMEIWGSLLEGTIAELAQRLNVVAWDPRFIDEVKKVRPSSYIGYQASEFLGDNVLRDQLTWDELELE